MSENSLIVRPDSVEIFGGPRVFTVNGYAAIRLAAGRHELAMTSERPFFVAIIPSEETKP
jgi:hypothetical protein